MKENPHLIIFNENKDTRGCLVAIVGGNNIPFEIARVYYIYNTPQNIERGFHAHRNLMQVLIAVNGIIEVTCEYHGQKSFYLLDSPKKGLLLSGLVWRTMKFVSDDSILMVLADTYYDESDYVRNYNDFITLEQNFLSGFLHERA